MADMSGLKERLRARYQTVADRACERALEATIAVAPFRENASIIDNLQVTDAVETGSFVWTAEISAPVDTALWTDKGTAPHIIRAVNARVLVFEVGGETRFAKEVHHPGQPAQNWFEQPMPERWTEAVVTALGEAE